MREHVASQIGDHPLAERGHQIVADGGGERDDNHQGAHGEKIDVDRAAALFREAEIDHRTQREWHGQCRGGGDCQRRQRRDRATEIAPAIADKRKQRRHGRCAVRRLSRHPLIHRRIAVGRHARESGRRREVRSAPVSSRLPIDKSGRVEGTRSKPPLGNRLEGAAPGGALAPVRLGYTVHLTRDTSCSSWRVSAGFKPASRRTSSGD